MLGLTHVPTDGEYVLIDGVRQRHGKGKYTDGPETYDGDWKCDAMHGKGALCSWFSNVSFACAAV